MELVVQLPGGGGEFHVRLAADLNEGHAEVGVGGDRGSLDAVEGGAKPDAQSRSVDEDLERWRPGDGLHRRHPGVDQGAQVVPRHDPVLAAHHDCSLSASRSNAFASSSILRRTADDRW